MEEKKEQKSGQKKDMKGTVGTEQLVAAASVLAIAIADNMTEMQLATVTNLLQLVTANLLAITTQRAVNDRQGIVLPDTTLFL